jgi:hypothetical protein
VEEVEGGPALVPSAAFAVASALSASSATHRAASSRSTRTQRSTSAAETRSTSAFTMDRERKRGEGEGEPFSPPSLARRLSPSTTLCVGLSVTPAKGPKPVTAKRTRGNGGESGFAATAVEVEVEVDVFVVAEASRAGLRLLILPFFLSFSLSLFLSRARETKTSTRRLSASVVSSLTRQHEVSGKRVNKTEREREKRRAIQSLARTMGTEVLTQRFRRRAKFEHSTPSLFFSLFPRRCAPPPPFAA